LKSRWVTSYIYTRPPDRGETDTKQVRDTHQTGARTMTFNSCITRKKDSAFVQGFCAAAKSSSLGNHLDLEADVDAEGSTEKLSSSFDRDTIVGNLLPSVPCLPAALATRKPCFPLLLIRMKPRTNSLLMHITPLYFPRIYFNSSTLKYMASECDSRLCPLTEIPRCSRRGDLLLS
jgi:hypothetical protein